MLKAFSGICAVLICISGCGLESTARGPAPSASPIRTAVRDLGAALLPAPPGMRVAYGPESGAYGTLRATREGAAAMRQGTSCAPRLDLDLADVRTAPAAVVAYSSDEGSVTQALVDLPSAYPAELPAACASYQAVVEGESVSYVTRTIDLPPLGDQSRAHITAVTGGGQSLEVGSVVIRVGTVVMSLLVVARKVKYAGLADQSREAYEKLTLAMNGDGR